MQGRVTISNERQQCNGTKRHILVKHMYFSLHINLNHVADNATTRIKLVAKKEMKDTNIEHTKNQI
jgi:hypothetical protein